MKNKRKHLRIALFLWLKRDPPPNLSYDLQVNENIDDGCFKQDEKDSLDLAYYENENL